MKIIPVIDVLNSIAVHGIRGERKHYQPLKSVLCNSANPLDLATTFNKLGFNSIYMADLDAIQGKTANFDIYKNITTQTGINLMVDAGISDLAKAEAVLNAGAQKIVVGTETLSTLDFVAQAVKTFGEDKVVVSIDRKEGKLLSTSDNIASMGALLIVKKLSNLGVRQIILLDLDRVGTEHGTDNSTIKNILKQTQLEVLVGGGIKSLQELEELRTLGVSGALIATVLHKGKLTVDELKATNFL
jgi:phosphoribosylformimino-5-aminoimidazole carboxamide ribotide isomerase